MDPAAARRLALDPSGILEAQGLTPDPWQRELLASPSSQILLNCSRQSGKSTVVAAKALHTAIFKPGSLRLVLCPAHHQRFASGPRRACPGGAKVRNQKAASSRDAAPTPLAG